MGEQKGIVIGAGFLGTRIANTLKYQLMSRQRVDVLSLDSINNLIEEEKPDVLINAVGKTGRPNIDECEIDKIGTIRLNVSGAINLASVCAERWVYFVHLGSGCMYQGDNNKKGWSEEDEPNFYGPQFYAMTKIDAERVLKQMPGLIVRLRMPIDDRPVVEFSGGNKWARDFISKVAGYKRVIDIKNSMTSVPHMIEAIRVLIEKRANGIYNFTNPGTISAYELMDMYRQILAPEHKFELLSLEELDKITLGKRSNCVLDSSKLERELKGTGADMPEIHEAAEECLRGYKLAEVNRKEYVRGEC